MARPAVSVIVPFAGPQGELDALLERLRGLDRRPDDEIVVVDNRPDGRAREEAGLRVLADARLASPAHARNVGAESSRGEWLVFFDADTEPRADLLGAYFEPGPAPRVGVLGGEVEDFAARPTLVARYVAARGMMGQRTTLAHPHRSFVQTANCAVRREAFEQVGGFAGEARAAEDADLCWRLIDAGWHIELRPSALVRHRCRETLGGLLEQMLVHGAGAAWLNDRRLGADPAPSPRSLVGRLKHYPAVAARAAAAGRREEAAFVLLDLLTLYAYDAGRLRSNQARR